jgi:hypothetical protein
MKKQKKNEDKKSNSPQQKPKKHTPTKAAKQSKSQDNLNHIMQKIK